MIFERNSKMVLTDLNKFCLDNPYDTWIKREKCGGTVMQELQRNHADTYRGSIKKDIEGIPFQNGSIRMSLFSNLKNILHNSKKPTTRFKGMENLYAISRK